MAKKYLHIIILNLLISIGLNAQNLVFKEIGRPDSSNSHWATFDVKYFGKDSLIICQANAKHSLHQLDESLNVIKYSDHFYIPDSLRDSLIGVSTYPGCFVDTDGLIRLYGDFTTSTDGMQYSTHKYTYTYNHQLDSIDSKLKNYYYLINDSIEFALVHDSIRYIEVFNRNSQKKYVAPFDSIVSPNHQSPTGLFYLKVNSSKSRIMMIFTSSRRCVVSSLDFKGNLKNQYIQDNKYYHSGFDWDSGLFLLSDHFEIKMFNENLDLKETVKVDSNETIFGVIPSLKSTNDYYIFSQEYFGKYVKYYKWTVSSNTLTEQGTIFNSNIQFNLHKVIEHSDSSFYLVGNFKLAGTSEMRNYVAILKGNPVGDSIHIDGNYHQLHHISPLSQKENQPDWFKIYPNPTSSFIRFNYSENTTFNYELSDLTGKSILRGKIKSNEQIDLNSYYNGIYVLTLHSDSTFKSFRIVKQ